MELSLSLVQKVLGKRERESTVRSRVIDVPKSYKAFIQFEGKTFLQTEVEASGEVMYIMLWRTLTNSEFRKVIVVVCLFDKWFQMVKFSSFPIRITRRFTDKS